MVPLKLKVTTEFNFCEILVSSFSYNETDTSMLALLYYLIKSDIRSHFLWWMETKKGKKILILVECLREFILPSKTKNIHASWWRNKTLVLNLCCVITLFCGKLLVFTEYFVNICASQITNQRHIVKGKYALVNYGVYLPPGAVRFFCIKYYNMTENRNCKKSNGSHFLGWH